MSSRAGSLCAWPVCGQAASSRSSRASLQGPPQCSMTPKPVSCFGRSRRLEFRSAMSDFLAWPDLAGRRVGIYGMGTEGRASLRACQALGIDPVLVDDRPQTQPSLVMSTSGAGLAELLSCEVVVVSPGISAYSEPVQSL